MLSLFMQKTASIQSLLDSNINTGLSKCPNVQGIQQLNASGYMGDWYEQTRIKHEFFQAPDSVCTLARYYNLNEDGSFVVENSTQDSIDQARHSIQGKGSCPYGNGECLVSFGNLSTLNKSNYIILDTDYMSYSIVYSCQLGKQYLWILSRDPVIDSQTYNLLLGNVQTLVPEFDLENLIKQEYQGSKCLYNIVQ